MRRLLRCFELASVGRLYDQVTQALPFARQFADGCQKQLLGLKMTYTDL